MEIKNQNIMKGAGPFHFEGNDIGILMIHGGGGGTCVDLKPLGEDLHKKGGYTISIPLLPGFGTSPEELKNINIEDWKSALYEELAILKQKCNKIIVGGHSMGAILTLILAANNEFDGIFTISALVGVKSFLFKLVPLFKIFVKYHHVTAEKFIKETDGKWIGYDRIPVNIGIKIKILLNEMKKLLPQVSCPSLLFQGRLDSDIKKNSMDYIFRTISAQKKKKIWLEHNEHPILESPDHSQIVSELFNFIQEICP
ncbi:MAG: alpha/beta hydrolase [Promethearchaeota archaeon]